MIDGALKLQNTCTHIFSFVSFRTSLWSLDSAPSLTKIFPLVKPHNRFISAFSICISVTVFPTISETSQNFETPISNRILFASPGPNFRPNPHQVERFFAPVRPECC